MSDDIDLRDFPFIPLYIQRLQKSRAWLLCKREPALAFYMVNLWVRAWHEVPCGSLEDDDDVLADAAMCDPKTWDKVRDRVLRGWARDGGRIYHSVVAEIAQASWESKQKRRQRTEAARLAKLQKLNGVTTDPAAGPATIPVTTPVTDSVTEPVTEDVTSSKGEIRDRDRDRDRDRETLEGEESANADSSGGASTQLVCDASPTVKQRRIEVDQVSAAWNAMACRSGLPEIRRMSSRRTRELGARLRDHGIDNLIEAIGKIGASAFCTGDNDRGWKADFDFLLQDRSLTRTLEGKYDNRMLNGKPTLWAEFEFVPPTTDEEQDGYQPTQY